jgi:hypothetical protein
MKESIIQQQICDYLSAVGVFYFSVPNEHYNISHGQRVTLHKMGMLSGIPDICILANNTCYFLEVKNETGKPSKQQLLIHNILTEKNFKVAIVRSVEDVQKIIKEWGIV